MKRLNSVELECCNWLKSYSVPSIILIIAVAVLFSLSSLKAGSDGYLIVALVSIPCVIAVVNGVKNTILISSAISEGNVFIAVLPVIHYSPTHRRSSKKTVHAKLTVLLDNEETDAEVLGDDVIIVEGKADVLVFRSGEKKRCFALSPVIDRFPESVVKSIYDIRGIKEEDFIDDSIKEHGNDLNDVNNAEGEL